MSSMIADSAVSVLPRDVRERLAAVAAPAAADIAFAGAAEALNDAKASASSGFGATSVPRIWVAAIGIEADVLADFSSFACARNSRFC